MINRTAHKSAHKSCKGHRTPTGWMWQMCATMDRSNWTAPDNMWEYILLTSLTYVILVSFCFLFTSGEIKWADIYFRIISLHEDFVLILQISYQFQMNKYIMNIFVKLLFEILLHQNSLSSQKVSGFFLIPFLIFSIQFHSKDFVWIVI